MQAEVKPLDKLILYGRYDWIDGDSFNDSTVTINGASGTIGPVKPSLWDVVIGAQYFLYENFKLIAEYRHGEKDLKPGTSANPDVQPIDQLKTTVEDAVYAGFRVVF